MASERVTDGEYRDIIGFLVVGDLSFTGRKQRNGKKLSPGIDFLSFSFLDFHASIALLPQILRCCLTINLGWKTAGETKREPPPPRRRCIAGNCNRSSNKTNWFIAFSVQSRWGTSGTRAFHLACHGWAIHLRQKLKDCRSIGVNKLPG